MRKINFDEITQMTEILQEKLESIYLNDNSVLFFPIQSPDGLEEDTETGVAMFMSTTDVRKGSSLLIHYGLVRDDEGIWLAAAFYDESAIKINIPEFIEYMRVCNDEEDFSDIKDLECRLLPTNTIKFYLETPSI